MTKKLLVEERGDRQMAKSLEVLDPSDLSAASSDMAKDIIEELAREPAYANELADRLDVHEQKVYYHVRRLVEAGLIEVVGEEEVQGALSKVLAPTADAFGFELPSGEKELDDIGTETPPEVRDFFHEFIWTGTFEGSIVVGSPDIHGPYDTASKDGHYPAHLTMFMGSLCRVPRDRFIVKLDTEVNAEDAHDRNMVLVGGPITNMVVRDLREDMETVMTYDSGWRIETDDGEVYDDKRDAMIAKVRNPWDEEKVCIVLAGTSREATKTCILALTQHAEHVLDGYDRGGEFYTVIRGLDRDGDGKVDHVEVLD